MPDPFSITLPSISGIFTFARKSVDPLAYGLSQDTVNLLAMVCKELCISDVLSYAGEGDPSLRELLETLHHKYHPEDSVDQSVHSQASEEPYIDHILEALLITTSLQLPHLTPSYVLRESTPDKIRRLAYHVQ